MTPAQIHQLGLDEVARIHGEIRKVMAEAGFDGTLQEFFEFMKTDPQFSFESEDALLTYYRSLEDRINKRIPEQFSLVPKAPFEIRPVEPYRAKSAAGGSYMTPSERSEEHTSELQSLMRISYAVFCLKKKTNNNQQPSTNTS